MRDGPRPLESLGAVFRSFGYANLALARLLAAAGDTAGALAAVRRRPYHGVGTVYLSSYLRLEGRLAAAAGDRVGAIRAYRHYLVLRAAPAASVAPEVARVKTELAALTP